MNCGEIRRMLPVALIVVLFAMPTWPNTPKAVPVLYPLSPSATLPGASSYTLTVRGVGFVSGSTVTWNGASLTTTFVSSSQLTATVPAPDLAVPNTATITVVSPGPGGGTSNFQYFVVEDSVTVNYFSSLSITGDVNLTSPIVGGDFNNDGKLDVIVASGPNVYTLAGNGDGTFGTAHGSNGPTNSVATGIHVADVNGDGKQDLIINGKIGTTGFVATMLGNGDGSFQAPIETTFTGGASSPVVVGDFNNDGILDVALISAGYVRTLLGNGDGTFHLGTPSFFATYAGRDGIACADFNRDGNLDVIITAYDPYSSTGYHSQDSRGHAGPPLWPAGGYAPDSRSRARKPPHRD